MTILRSLDRNLSCRALRDLLVQTTPGGPLDARLPHTFETEALLEAARLQADSPTVSDGGRLRVLARSGEAHLLCDREVEGRALLERGLSISRTNQERAQFLLRIGHHVHDRRDELTIAREKLRLAFTLSERSRRLRTEILLRLGSVERRLGRDEAARRSLEAGLDLHIRSLEPHVLLELAELAAGQGDLTEGERLIERGHARFEGEANWLGTLVAQARLGVLLRRRGEARAAARILGEVTVRQERVLDLVALGPTYHELGLSWSAAGHPEAARDAFLRAIGYGLAATHTRALARDYLELGRCLSRLRDHDAALAAFDRSLDLSFEVDEPAFEFQVLTDVASISARAGHRRDVIPEVLGRLYAILDERPDVLSKSLLERFARMTRDVMLHGRVDALRTPSVGHHRPRLIGDAGAQALDRLVPGRRWWDFGAVLAGRLGDGPPGRSVPEPGDLCRFLLLYAGDTFKSGHYTREFGLSQERAKRHLRWLCANGIIEREGNRKAARYSLAFHRQARETREPLAKAT